MKPALDPDYYLHNFWLLLDGVHEQYDDILLKHERAYRSQLAKLSKDAQRLYVRLISRVAPLFRTDKLKYSEINDLEQAADELIRAGYLDSAEDADIEDVVALLTKPELADLLGQPQLKNLKREELVDLVYTLQVLDLPFGILRTLQEEVLTTYRLLFFGNLQQDLTDFVLSDLGLVRYEDTVIDSRVRAFPSRSALDELLALYALFELSREALAEGDTGALIACGKAVHKQVRDPAIPQRRKDRLSNEIARQLERQNEFEAALQIYALAQEPPARERRARVLHKLACYQEALALVEQIVEDPRDEAEREFGLAFRRKLQKLLDLKQDAALSPVRLTAKNCLELELEAGDNGVEELVRAHIEAQGAACYYVENSLFNGLFGLAFWDIIFAPVPGAFFNRYQNRPSDLYTADFVEARAALIEQRLSDPDLLTGLLQTYRRKEGLANPFVDWRLLDETVLSLALERIPNEQIRSVFSRLLQDLRANSSGFPDLVSFPEEGGYELIEVKGPGDRLQANQKRWIRHFEAHGIPYRVALVTYTST